MRVGSTFSGCGGFDLGFERAGCEVVWQSEIDHFCRKILRRRFPNASLFGDIRKLTFCSEGVPCQDVSVAGKREGLAGQRTRLVYDFARVLRWLRPPWFVFENVPGLLSSNEGRDFAEVLRLFMVECRYGVSWRVLDSRYFNVAQRRERVFLVGRFGRPCPTEILFESASGNGHFTKSRATRKDLAKALTGGAGSIGSASCGSDDGTNIVNALTAALGHHGWSLPRDGSAKHLVAHTLSAGNHRSHAPGRRREDDFNLVARTITRSSFKRHDDDTDTLIADCTYAIHTERPSGQRQKQNATKSDGHVTGRRRHSKAFNTDRVRNFAGLPEGMDSPRYRALGNAVTVSVAEWIARRIVSYSQKEEVISQ